MSAARTLLLLAAAAALPARAQDDVTVTSPQADSIAVTIYRDDLALITETRTVDLPASAVTLVFEDVVETLLPQSAIVTELDRPLAESNFDFDRLTPRTLLERSIGATVTLTRTHPATGRVTRTQATIVAVGEGVVLRTADGHEALYCSGLPERLELERVPGGLLSKPRLSVRLAPGAPDRRTVAVSYLAHGFAWSSDYVARLNARSTALELKGWATLTNATGTVFRDAEVQLVAGRLNILRSEEGGSAAPPVYPLAGESAVDARARELGESAAAEVALLRECFATDLPAQTSDMDVMLLARPAPRAGAFALEELVVSGARIAREELGDYQLYRLPWRTDLNARQTKQVLFLDEPEVRVERFYGYRLDTLLNPPEEDVAIPRLILRFENTAAAGLGEPLPRGVVRVFEQYGGRDVLAGEAEIGDRPVGLPVELAIGRALNVLLETTLAWEDDGGSRDRVVVAAEHRIVNNKAAPIEIEIRHRVEGYYTDVEVERTSHRMRPKYGDLAWRFTVRPGEELLRYELSAREPR